MKYYPKTLFYILITFQPFFIWAQTSYNITDVERLNDSSYYLKYSNPESAKLVARQAWLVSESLAYAEGKARALSRLAGAHMFNNEPDSALKYFQKSLEFRQSEDLGYHGKVIMYKQIGYLYTIKDMYEQAISNLKQGLNIATINNSSTLKSDLQRRLAEVYIYLAGRKLRARDSTSAKVDQTLAISYSKASLKNTNRKNTPGKYANSCIQISSIYQIEQEFDSTLFFLNKAIGIYDSLYNASSDTSYLKELAKSFSRKGRTYDELNQLHKGSEFHKKAVSINRSVTDTLNLFASLINMGDNFLRQKKYNKALEAFEEANDLSPDGSSDKELLRALNNNLAEVHNSIGNHKLAVQYLKKSLELNTAIYVESSDAQIQDATENIKLESENKQKEIQANYLRKQSRGYLWGGIILTALLSIILYFSYQKQSYQKIIIENQEATHMNKLLSQLEEAEQQILSDQSAKQQMLLTAIGKELHDSIGSMLSAAKREMENLRNSLTDIPAKAEGQFDHSYGMVDKAIRDLRKISKSPDKLSLDEQLVPSLRELCKNINRIENSPHIELNTYRLEGVKLPAKHELHIFRIIQEAITNIIKHAQATEVHMQLDWANRILSITIEDNGKGFDPKKIKHGVGLDSMRSRTEELNGTFTLDTAPGKGSTLFMEISIPG